ncbi:MAG: two-component system C4-dicarboxylate transport sensor histidine kinase DctB [Sulfurimonas sp.]|jgi:two-component system C4-dicarboxylate transport sensor histidine kinase DctB
MPTAKNKASCLQCHGDPKDAPTNLIESYGSTSGFNEKVGDIRAMISLKIAVSSIIMNHKDEFITGGLAMFIVFIIFILLIYLIYKKDMRLKERKDNLFMHQDRLAIMGSMIGNISHQWKQPLSQLSYILINLELLSERNKLTNEKVLSKVEAANVQISFMSDSINDFKNFFSPKKVMGEHNVEDILDQSQRLLQATLDQHAIKLSIDKSEGFIFYGSYNELVQVFLNIINNAKDAFVSNKTKACVIQVKAYKENNKNIITIENNAGTIDQNVIDKIFEPYFSTKDLEVSSGIGLYICKLIIENNNGTIDVKNLDKGVIFTIKF